MSRASQPCLQRWLCGQPFKCHASQSPDTSSSCSCTRLVLLDMNSRRTYITSMANRAWVPVLVDPAHISVSIWLFQSHSNWSPHNMVSQSAQVVTATALHLTSSVICEHLQTSPTLILRTLLFVTSCESHQNLPVSRLASSLSFQQGGSALRL